MNINYFKEKSIIFSGFVLIYMSWINIENLKYFQDGKYGLVIAIILLPIEVVFLLKLMIRKVLWRDFLYVIILLIANLALFYYKFQTFDWLFLLKILANA